MFSKISPLQHSIKQRQKMDGMRENLNRLLQSIEKDATGTSAKDALKEFCASEPDFENFRELIPFVFKESGNIPNVKIRNDTELLWLNNIINFSKSTEIGKDGPELKKENSIYSFGVDYDDIYIQKDQWSFLKALSYYQRLSLKPRKRVALVASMRNEGIIFLEWVAHYRALGFDKIIVCMNDTDDGSLELARILAKAGVLHLVENTVREGCPPQQKGIYSIHYLVPELADCDWAFYADADEFLMINADGVSDINSFIEHALRKNSNADAIQINWKWFGGGGQMRRSDGLLMTRFQLSRPDSHVKTMFKLRSSLCPGIHHPQLKDDAVVLNGSLEQIKATQIQLEPSYKAAQINHYWNRSFEEFITKMLRRRGAVALNANEQRQYHLFFGWDSCKTNEPPPSNFLHKVEAEYQQLLTIPNAADQLQIINNNFCKKIKDFDAEHGLERIYKEAQRQAGLSTDK